eukprot:Colp12_sorted_trinity150504_noHs@30991
MADTKTQQAENTYVTKPDKQKFMPAIVKNVIRDVLAEKLQGVEYEADKVTQITKDVADEIRNRIKALELSRYKIVVQVLIGEQRGEGVKMSCRCLWDPETDNYVQDVFMNESFFCVAAAFGIYYY